jgi:lambda family phage portal protein
MISLDLPQAMRERDAEDRREAQLRRPAKPTSRNSLSRGYNAARWTRLTSDWSTSQTTANQEIRRDLRALRARSRELARNKGVMRKFLSMMASNVVGSQGITLRVIFDPHGNSTTERDAELSKQVEAAFTEWSRPENASASGKLSWIGVCAHAVRMMARDGEFLCREILDADNAFGYALNFRDPAWLSETYNTMLGGNRVLMSVEVNQYDRPVRYWLTRPSSDYLYPELDLNHSYRTPVPASEIIHKFLITEDEIQTRGVPMAHAAMEDMNILGGVVDAELYASRANACNTDYVMPPDDEDDTGDDEPPDGFKTGEVRELESAVMTVLPPGYKVQSNDPKHPNANLGNFMKSVKRDIASALEVSYESLANDRENVNYSSIRAGLLEERDIWRFLQTFMIEHFCHRVFQNWLKSAMLTGAVQLSIRDFERVRDSWRPRGWDWVDPLKDIQAAILAIMNGLESRTDYCDERGDDFLDNVKKLGMERKAMEAEGLALAADALKPIPPKADKTTPGEKPLSPSDEAANEDAQATRVLPMFEEQLLPRMMGNGQQPIIIVLNQQPTLPAAVQPLALPKPSNGDSILLDD